MTVNFKTQLLRKGFHPQMTKIGAPMTPVQSLPAGSAQPALVRADHQMKSSWSGLCLGDVAGSGQGGHAAGPPPPPLQPPASGAFTSLLACLTEWDLWPWACCCLLVARGLEEELSLHSACQSAFLKRSRLPG